LCYFDHLCWRNQKSAQGRYDLFGKLSANDRYCAHCPPPTLYSWHGKSRQCGASRDEIMGFVPSVIVVGRVSAARDFQIAPRRKSAEMELRALGIKNKLGRRPDHGVETIRRI
jgi:hypothetical protein